MLEKKNSMENNSSRVVAQTAAANGATGSNSNSDDTLYLCNFQVFADGDWLCLKELDDQDTSSSASSEISRQRKPPDSLAITPELDRLEKIYPNYPVGNPKERDPIQIEKSNLVNILKLVIKEVLDSSLRFGHQLDSDHIPLQHFFIVLEHIMRHGLKAKKGLLGPKKELWDFLQLVEKKQCEAVDITASVRELPTVKTPSGRARAWLRLALMQKKLADYFRHLVDQGDEVLAEFYEPRALLRSEESSIVTGLLLSLNIVDCNLCVKEEDLECQQGVIDFSLYLRLNKGDSHGTVSTTSGASGLNNEDSASTIGPDITAVLDQKNYVEELNRHLNSTMSTMQSKIEGLTTTNALMKEDLSICRNALSKTQEENRKLLNKVDKSNAVRADQAASSSVLSLKSSTSSSSVVAAALRGSPSSTSSKGDESSSPSKSSKEFVAAAAKSKAGAAALSADNNIKQKLAEEVRKREELQKELGLQKSMKAEMEMAMKLLEKDVHHKQDTIVCLRDQLEDIKDINLEMYTKLSECEGEIAAKSDIIVRLEIKTEEISRLLMRLNSLPKN